MYLIYSPGYLATVGRLVSSDLKVPLGPQVYYF